MMSIIEEMTVEEALDRGLARIGKTGSVLFFRSESCGTPKGERQHRRYGNPICSACREAHKAYRRDLDEARDEPRPARPRQTRRKQSIKRSPCSCGHPAVQHETRSTRCRVSACQCRKYQP